MPAESFPKLPCDMVTDVVLPVGYNYLAGLGDLVNAFYMLKDEESIHQKQLAFQSILTILSGMELITFSYAPYLAHTLLGVTGVGSAAYGVKSLADVINLSIEIHNDINRITFEGWLKDSLQQMNRFDSLIERYRQQLRQLEATQKKKPNPLLEEYWDREKNRLNNKISELTEKKSSLSEDIKARSIVYIANEETFHQTRQEEAARKAIILDIAKETNSSFDCQGMIDSFYDEAYQNHDYDELRPTASQKQRDQIIQKQCQKKLNDDVLGLTVAAFNLIASGLLFASIFYPPLLVPAAIMAVTATVIGSIYTTRKIMDTADKGPKLSTHSNSFFAINVKERPKELRRFHASLAARM